MWLTTYYLLLTTIFSGRGEGFCRSYSGLALGYEACGWNPATLAVAPDYSFNIATVGLEYNSNLRFSDYLRLIKGIHLSESDKAMFQNGEKFDFCASAQAISFSRKELGVMSYVYSNQTFTIPKDVTDLFLWGNEIDRTYSLKGIEGKNEICFTIVLSGAQVFGRQQNFALGGGLKYIYGISYMDVDSSAGFLKTTFDSSDVPQIFGEGLIVSRYADGGYGLGIDLGAFYTFGNWFLSISAINVFSEMVWDVDPRIEEASFKLDPVDLETFNPETSFDWDKKKYNKIFSTSFEPRADLSFGIKKKQFCITGGAGYPRLISIGAEKTYGFLILRTGCAFEEQRLWTSFGFGMIKNMLHLDIGIRGNSTSHFSGGLSISVIPSERKPPSKKKFRHIFK